MDTLLFIPTLKVYVIDILDRRMDGIPDRQTDIRIEILIRGGLGNLIGSSRFTYFMVSDRA